jgi:dTDP-4-amino-4,6-dideoxygalactose transaminase
MKIDFLDLKSLHNPIQKYLHAAFECVLESGWFVMGPELEAFESEFTNYCDVKRCIGLGNGLEAIHLFIDPVQLALSPHASGLV